MRELDGHALDILRLLVQGHEQSCNGRGVQALMQRGLVTRVGRASLRITDKGRGFIEGVDHVLRAM